MGILFRVGNSINGIANVYPKKSLYPAQLLESIH